MPESLDALAQRMVTDFLCVGTREYVVHGERRIFSQETTGEWMSAIAAQQSLHHLHIGTLRGVEHHQTAAGLKQLSEIGN